MCLVMRLWLARHSETSYLETVLLTQRASLTKVLVPQAMSVRSSLRHSSPQRFPVAILINIVDCQLRQLWSHRPAIVRKDVLRVAL